MEFAEKFYQRWDFPNGIGAINGKYIVMQQAFHSVSHYRNYEGTDSIKLLVMIGPEYKFL